MTSEQATAAGQVLAGYANNLNYFSTFIKFANNEFDSAAYCTNQSGMFTKFLNRYAVARNTSPSKHLGILRHALKWHQDGHTDEVDNFAQYLKEEGLTHENLALSLSSKVMYLMNPQEILPLDNLAKLGVGYKGKNYKDFREKVEQFRKDNQAAINEVLGEISGMLTVIEANFGGKIEGFEKIRENRFLDKWLSVIGLRLSIEKADEKVNSKQPKQHV